MARTSAVCACLPLGGHRRGAVFSAVSNGCCDNESVRSACAAAWHRAARSSSPHQGSRIAHGDADAMPAWLHVRPTSASIQAPFTASSSSHTPQLDGICTCDCSALPISQRCCSCWYRPAMQWRNLDKSWSRPVVFLACLLLLSCLTAVAVARGYCFLAAAARA